MAAFRDAHIAFGAAGRTHVATRTGGGHPALERSAPFFTVNTLVANPPEMLCISGNTALKATHKCLSPKHLPDHLGAFCWTTNRRRNMRGMVSALCRAVATSSHLTHRGVYA